MDDAAFKKLIISKSKNRSHPSLATVEPTDVQLEVFRVLYPLFKDEVFKRREQMMRLTAFASTFLAFSLVTLLPMAPWETAPSLTRWLAISGVGIFSSLFAYLILQHAERHRMAKQQLIELEQTLGLYQEGWQPTGNALFPKHWQSDWTADRSVTIYLATLAILTTLVICSLLIQI